MSLTVQHADKSGRDFSLPKSSDWKASCKKDRDRGVNIQVVLRCRPFSEDEVKAKTPAVISCNEFKREVLAIQNIGGKQTERTFIFDRVFGPTSQQHDLFNQVVSPIVSEVLEGYNCTIFAYGQTGTGKTYTMEGGKKPKNGEVSQDAGVIPRAVQQIFDTLGSQNVKYSMKVQFLELYNEEITDLLAPEDLNPSEKPPRRGIALMEDGKGGVSARGLEEETVCSASEIYKILDTGTSKRRTAETLLNKQSSRSHSIFTIAIQIKESPPGGNEMIKCGKLNLVDLAGSENILRSGAREGRAREAGKINKSLLTLGRVINGLVEHSGHVPYRDSKLTRLLRDSLGGKTKTCIIATITPSIYCLEETLSTLDYARRAKDIKNKPEVNQKMRKSEVIKDLCFEINRLKQEIYATREKNGVYIPRDLYLHEEAHKKSMAEKMEQLELKLELKDEQLVWLQELYNSQKLLSAQLNEKLEKTQRKLENTECELFELDKMYTQANSTVEENEYLIYNLLKSEKALVDHTQKLRSELENAAAEVSSLFTKIDCKDKIEDGNRILVRRFFSQLTQQLDLLHKRVSNSVMHQENELKEMEEDMQSFLSAKAKATEEIHGWVKKLRDMYDSTIGTLDNLSGDLDQKSQSIFRKFKSQVSTNTFALDEHFKGIAVEADQLLYELQASLSTQENKLTAFAQQHHEGYLRNVETRRSISKITTAFFSILDAHTNKLSTALDESKNLQEQQLFELEKKFEECASNEDNKLLVKVTEMLAMSAARKKEMAQEAIESLRERSAKRACNIQKEIYTAFDFTQSAKEQWACFMQDVETNYSNSNAALGSGRCSIAEDFQQWRGELKARLGAQLSKDAQSSLFSLGKDNVAKVDWIIRSGMNTTRLIRAKLSSSAYTALEDADKANKGLLSLIDHPIKLNNDTCEIISSLIVPCCQELRVLHNGHYQKIMEIKESVGKQLEEAYVVDEASCSASRKQFIDLPSMTAIEEIRGPSFKLLSTSVWEMKLHTMQPI